MNEYRITVNGKEKKIVKLPSGRHEVTLEQWNNAYKYVELALEANRLFEEGKIEESQAKIIESMCGTISALGKGITYEELLQVDYNKINNLFLIQFDWLSKENVKREFRIKGKKFIVPKFEKATCGDFMDVMSLLAMHEDYNDAEKGLLIAAVYMRNGEYYQDLEEINERIEFLKQYGRMDLFYSCAFFLSSSLKSYKIDIQRHLAVVKEVEKLTSTLVSWGTILYSQTLQRQEYFRTM